MASHRVAGRKLSRYRDQRVALLRGLVAELIIHERITTTLAKAKETRMLAEKLITHGKKGNFANDAIIRLHHRRLAMAQVPNTGVVKKVFDDVSVRYAERAGGYTRILKLGPRNGDAAEMAIIELV
ncbi:MAG: 50S ribosomal protein L17 [Chloroflexi bacterium]|uniref:Ribosomal protein L17 n=1 Tax=marine metagenome TaxID=408172 RepID=A0A382ZPW8_9ZZZZ|nr:50S ribosomal protein L17 [Chloroflexota bacterium]MDP7588201.1 50S ribosomal protein L17 [Dehalococcoidia bacterium]MQF88921.1 50S ribosomal protein L17 [SAR202 cluster bacterium]MQG11057.1 50S ribosomal protein L17 [SAR202 cluster bacterium]MQG54078.1 50S ribosomal protein L17 [SAR202 cluster bacterium]